LYCYFIYDRERLEKINAIEDAFNMKYELNDHIRYYSPKDKLHAISYSREYVNKICEDHNFRVEKNCLRELGEWKHRILPGLCCFKENIVPVFR